MMKRKEIKMMASNMADFLESGMTMSDSVARLNYAMPKKYNDLWASAATAIKNGYPLSKSLSGYWPESLLSVLRAGEDSGTVASIIREIEATIEVEEQVIKSSMRVLYPIAMVLGGIGIALFFMLTVLPSIGENLDGSESGLISFATSMKTFTDENSTTILAAIPIILFMLFMLSQNNGFKTAMLNSTLSVPVLKEAMMELQFGLWAKYFSLCTSAGIPTITALKMTENVVIEGLRPVIQALHKDLSRNVSLAEAVDKSRMRDSDPRQTLMPFFIENAFGTAAQTGKIDASISKVAPSLVKQGTKKLDTFVGVFRVVAIAIAAIAILGPLGVVYTELFRVMEEM